ncbi:MAG: hypothetical protein GC158_07925 [Cyanobacteria bacterium RI_101]|nr:hypothetical protein [Cyanobacteria bacterium RI_101]
MGSLRSKPLQRLYRQKLRRRWLFVGLCWFCLAPWALWQFREDFLLLEDHFTFTAVRYGLAFRLVPAFSLFFCVGITGSTLFWQSCHLLWGLSPQERRRWRLQARKLRDIRR